MIQNISCKDTRNIWNGIYSKKFPKDNQERALRKLRQIDAAQNIDDLKNPPANRVENLKGDREGQMSIRINKKMENMF